MSSRDSSEKKVSDGDFDIHDPAFVLEPYSTYELLRSECPVQHSKLHGGYWLVVRYADVRQAAIDWRTFTSSVVGVTAIPIITRRTEPMLPIEIDPPLHSRYRALVNPVFSPQRIEELRPRVAAITARLVDHLVEHRGGDLVADFAIPLSVGTMAEFTGLPIEDSGLWVAWIRRMFNIGDPSDSARASREFGAYIDDLVRARRALPCGDFVSLLMESEVEGHRLTDKEIHSFCTVLFGAGFETTADALSVMLYYLAEHPEDQRRLAADPALIPGAVEEFLRFISPIQIFGRNTTRDVEMHGQTIPKGDVVALSFGSANHDPSVFPAPGRCVLDRTPNRHLAFGAGIHHCLGAPVARLEMTLALQEFSRRVTSLTVAQGGTVKWKTRGDRRGLDALPAVIEGS